jgi:2'-5' RNA ligase
MSVEVNPPGVFFGIFPDPPARKALATIARAAARDTGGNSPRAERIHLTLLYLSGLQQEQIDTLLALATGIKTPPFDLCLTSLEWWRKNNIVCATPEDKAAITTLAQALALQMGRAGFQGVRGRFAPHVTMVRKALHAPPENMAPVSWTVNRFRLVRSHLNPGDVRYETLAEFPLTD